MNTGEPVRVNTALMAVMAEARLIFGDSQVTADDNFFALGGTSLDLLDLAERLESQYGLKISLADLFAAESLAEIAQIARKS